ncbi:unnamed protein product [Closterium sp. NIES-65]|nr:unnamed protein product [Closterium sp. NIES-65]
MQLIQDQCKETKTSPHAHYALLDVERHPGRLGILPQTPSGPASDDGVWADREQHEEETRVQAREAAADVVTVEELAEEEIPQEAEVEAAANSQPEDEARREARVPPEAELAAAGEAVTGGFPRVGGVAAATGEIADPAAAATIGSGQRALPLRAGGGEEMTGGRGEPVCEASGIEAGTDSTRGACGRRRPQPEPRRLGVTLAPTLPGPLWGWLRQEPMPHDPADPTTLGAAAEAVQVGDIAASQRQKRLRMTTASNTSPHALRVARRGEESQPHEQRRGELVGREGIAASEELAEDQEAGGDAATVAAAVGNGATVTESEAVEVVVAAGPEGVAAEATGAEVAVESDGPDAAFGGGSASPSAIPQAWQPEEPGPAVALERTKEVELAASPEPVTASVLVAAVTAAAGERDRAWAEEDAPTAAASARTSAATEGASKQGHDRGGIDRRGHGPGGTAGAARGKMKLRAQPAPRRPGAGLGPGPPGPLLGWLLQGQLPQGQERHWPFVGTSGGDMEAGNGIRQAPTVNTNVAGNAVAGPSTQQPPRRDSRSSTEGGGG